MMNAFKNHIDTLVFKEITERKRSSISDIHL